VKKCTRISVGIDSSSGADREATVSLTIEHGSAPEVAYGCRVVRRLPVG
jgi:hypothetical protein